MSHGVINQTIHQAYSFPLPPLPRCLLVILFIVCRAVASFCVGAEAPLMSTSVTAKWGWVAADNWALGMKSLISVNGLDTPDAAFLPFVHLPLSSVFVSEPLSNRQTQGLSAWCHRIVPSSRYYSFVSLPLLCSAVVIYSLMLIFTSGPHYKPSQDRDPSCIFMQIS